MKGQSIVKGSIILLMAHFMVKIIGAGFKIPLQNLIGNEGMGYFGTAYTIYSGIFIIATAGLPVAVSKMIAESNAKGNTSDSKRIFKTAFWLFFVIGVIGSATIYFCADAFSKFITLKEASICVKMFSPAIFFVSLMSAFRGFFQGNSNMVPTAASEVIEAFGKLIFGLVLAYVFFNQGLVMAATGAVIGVSSGAILAFLLLAFIYISNKKTIFYQAQVAKARPYRTILKELVYISFPITISASVFTVTNLIDVGLITRRLEILFKDETVRSTLYGMYSSQGVTMYSMPAVIITAICITLVPAIARAYVLKDKKTVDKTISLTIKFTMYTMLAAAVGMGVLASPILTALFKSNEATLLLQLLCPAVVFVSLVLVTNAILQATGNMYIPLVNIAIAGIIKIAINYTLVAMPQINILGASIGTSICYLVYALLNIRCIIRKIGTKLSVVEYIIKPILVAGVMGIVTYVLYYYVNPYFSGRIGNLALATSVGCIGFLVFVIMVFKLKVITKQELVSLPKGDKIIDILEKVKLV